ncbi:aminoglycoside phosphotransferase family protein [Couchioplanes caeruleus]|uniref:aminoglycoside phosphotransferase family protein n=1 Tax=Couchioplanes caeruleus TaxID=56438 RepID=UPI0020C02A66|nr:aminoglycoside phosphotransferase family protein [Couchioplanes caeruleus]UQU62150.1 aminoglycoside phosphotransferase family protein [Couchioplanes caeruleus]
MRMHADEVATDETLVRRLLAAQFPQWAGLPARLVPSYGTDHDVYRLGADLVVRLPRIGWAAQQAAREATWLPWLAPQVPLALPEPVGLGEPQDGYPFPWSVCRWLPGENADGTIDDLDRAAGDLAGFVRAMRRLDPALAPDDMRHDLTGPQSGDEDVRRSIAQLGDRIDGPATLRSWEETMEAAPHDGPGAWVHGDLLPGNVLVTGGRITAAIDFGGLSVRDPSRDLLAAWTIFTGTSRERYREALEADDASWLRGRGWALRQAVGALSYYWDTNPGMVRMATRELREVLIG